MIGCLLERNVFYINICHCEDPGAPFCTWGIHFGDPGSHGDTSWDTFGSRLEYFMVFGGFGIPLETTFGTDWPQFCDSGHENRSGNQEPVS